ncbi:MAG: Lar family restriction alleviation protein [Vicinamibacteria bacterium]
MTEPTPPELLRAIYRDARRIEYPRAGRERQAMDGRRTSPEVKLAPCPFCAEPKKIFGLSTPARNGTKDTVKHWLWCRTCGAGGPHRDSELEAVQAWNGRRP